MTGVQTCALPIFSPDMLQIFEPLGIAATPRSGQSIGLGFMVRTQRGEHPTLGEPRRILLAGGLGNGFLYRSEEKAGCGRCHFSKHRTTSHSFTISYIRRSSTNETSQAVPYSIEQPAGFGGYGPSRRGRYADAGSECRRGRVDPNRDLSCQVAPWREKAQDRWCIFCV